MRSYRYFFFSEEKVMKKCRGNRWQIKQINKQTNKQTNHAGCIVPFFLGSKLQRKTHSFLPV